MRTQGPSRSGQIRVVIADDHPLMRAGVRGLLEAEPDIDIVGEAASGTEALRLVQSTHPDVLLLDMAMPGMSGVDVARSLQAEGTRTQVLALTAHDDRAYVAGLLASGAAGYITKEQPPWAIIEAVRAVARGEGRWFVSLKREDTVNNLMTERESDVLKLMARGLSNQQIADTLHISSHTVRNHVASIYTKLEVNSWREAVAWAWEHGLMRN